MKKAMIYVGIVFTSVLLCVVLSYGTVYAIDQVYYNTAILDGLYGEFLFEVAVLTVPGLITAEFYSMVKQKCFSK